jgi:DNA-binding GntR family transcriptional regulator
MAIGQLSTFKSKKELVYEFLRTEILRGTFEPGSRIIIGDVAAQLGVSQVPIREALQQLQAEGFVVMEPHIGPRVAEIQAHLIWEIFQLLEALEVISSREACHHMQTADFEAMEAILHTLDELDEDSLQWSQENTRLHSSICDWGGTLLVKSIMNTVLDQWDRLRNHYLKDMLVHRKKHAQQEHWAMFTALQGNDANLVEDIVRKHNRNSLALYVKQLQEAGQLNQAHHRKTTGRG